MTELTEAEIKRLVLTWPWPTEAATNAEGFRHVADTVSAIIDARLAPIRAVLADAEKYDDERLPTCDFYGNRFTTRIRQEDLRAALDAASGPVSAQHGTEGQGEGCETCRGEVWCPICEDRREAALPPLVHNHLPYRPPCAEREVDGQLRGACLNDDGSTR